MIFHTRSEVFGDAAVLTSGGSPRPAMAPGRPFLAVHHVGAGSWVDSGDTPNEIRSIHANAVSRQIPWEYNYVVDSDGHVWEYAGGYMAAHSRGDNDDAYGVLLLADTMTEGVSDAMVNGLRQLRAKLLSEGRLSSSHQVKPHKDMPGGQITKTVCPGTNAMARWADLTAPWSEPAPPTPTPPPPVEEDETIMHPELFRFESDHAVWIWSGIPGDGKVHVRNPAELRLVESKLRKGGFSTDIVERNPGMAYITGKVVNGLPAFDKIRRNKYGALRKSFR